MTQPRIFLPVVLPPGKTADQSDILAYYSAIQKLGVEVTADAVAGELSLEITIAKSDQLHPSDQFADPRPFSSVFAPTSGFVRFYPSAATLPAPLAPLNPPSNLADIGTLVIRVWIPDLMSLTKTPADSPPRPNRIALGWLQTSTVTARFKSECEKQSLKILQKSWVEGGETTPPPDDKTVLASKFLDRFMKGTVEMFISAGTEIGTALVAGKDAKLKLQAFSQIESQIKGDPDSTVSVAADDVIDNAATEALFEGHPLILNSNAAIQITFKSTFTIWNNVTKKYEALADRTGVSLMKAPGDILVAPKQTTSAGQFTAPLQPSPPLMKRDLIFFRYDTTGIRLGDRTFDSPIDTDPHLARLYLEANGDNIRTYRASDRIYPAYQVFQDDLSKKEDEDMYVLDRGNSNKSDNSTSGKVGFSNQLFSRLGQIKNSETVYHGTKAPRFTVLFEGDSWLDYPVDETDMFKQLDDWFRKKATINGFTYVAFPLQYHGDRSDQMFVGGPADANRQWHFTYEFLREYKIDLIVCSAGGNDFAEPGISHWQLDNTSMTAEPYVKCITGTGNCIKGHFDKSGNTCYFDPSLMSEKNLTADQQAIALRLMDKSFAALLNNHPWHLYDRDLKTAGSQTMEKSLRKELNDLLAGNGDFGDDIGMDEVPKPQDLNKIGRKVVSNFGDLGDLPNPASSDWRHKLLVKVFDSVKYRARFDSTLNNWRILLTEAQSKGIPVIAHSYCYPIFSQKNTTGPASSKKYNGPWFAPRFYQAKILDLRVRCICLKTMIDNYKSYVLNTLHAEFPTTFDYVDLTKPGFNQNQDARFWADEMHLTSTGFQFAAKAIYDQIAVMPTLKDVFK